MKALTGQDFAVQRGAGRASTPAAGCHPLRALSAKLNGCRTPVQCRSTHGASASRDARRRRLTTGPSPSSGTCSTSSSWKTCPRRPTTAGRSAGWSCAERRRNRRAAGARRRRAPGGRGGAPVRRPGRHVPAGGRLRRGVSPAGGGRRHVREPTAYLNRIGRIVVFEDLEGNRWDLAGPGARRRPVTRRGIPAAGRADSDACPLSVRPTSPKAIRASRPSSTTCAPSARPTSSTASGAPWPSIRACWNARGPR